MKRLYVAAALLSVFSFQCSVFSQTQSGVVRTVARPDQPSQKLQGVVVRPQGDFNPAMTDENGTFEILMPGQKNGAAFALAGVNKGGYELREPEMVGRQLSFSTSVPMEIIMVSRRQLQRDKQRIEQAARENIEKFYEQQLNALNEQLTQAKLSNQEYEAQLNQLEQQYDRFEPLIDQMAERYARTDYTTLSPADSLIQQAIEQGDLQLAQERILAKGDPNQREKKMQRIRRMAEAQRDELAADYYNLYAIYLSRFENDSALSFIVRRAMLDTTNAQWQIDAGNAYDKMSRNYEQALILYRRALRYAIANEGPQSLRAAQAHNNVAFALVNLTRYKEALPEHLQALQLYEKLFGSQHEMTAARNTNVGTNYHFLAQLDSAQYYFKQAEQIYSELEKDPETMSKNIPMLHAQLLNNQGAIYFTTRQFDGAYERFYKALQILPEGQAEGDRVTILSALGVVCYHQEKLDEARAFWSQAYDLSLRIYGADHPTTQELVGNLKLVQQ